MYRVYIDRDVNGELYERLMRYMFLKSDSFSLLCRDEIEDKSSIYAFLKLLDSQFLKREIVMSWPGTTTTKHHELYYFKTSEESLITIFSVGKGLMQLVHPFLPEDLAIYNGTDLQYFSTVHENHFVLLLKNESEYNEFLAIGDIKHNVSEI